MFTKFAIPQAFHTARHNKMINKNYHTVGTIAKSNTNITECIPLTQTLECSLSCLDTGTSRKRGGVKLIIFVPEW